MALGGCKKGTSTCGVWSRGILQVGIAGGLRARRSVARNTVVRWFAIMASAALLGSLVAVSGALSASAAGEGTILALVNEARTASGLGPLVLWSLMVR